MISLQKYHFEPITEDRLCVMLPIDHPFAEKPALTIADLAAEPLILMHPYTSIYQLCMQLFEKAGVKPQILRTARLESTISSVEIGEAFSLFAESNFELFRHPNVTAVPLLDAPPLVIGASVSAPNGNNEKTSIKIFFLFHSRSHITKNSLHSVIAGIRQGLMQARTFPHCTRKIRP